jgi:hypothetical protein
VDEFGTAAVEGASLRSKEQLCSLQSHAAETITPELGNGRGYEDGLREMDKSGTAVGGADLHTERIRAHPLPGIGTAAARAEDGGWPEVLRARLARYPPHLDRRPAPLGLSRQGTHTTEDIVFRGALAAEWPRGSGPTTGPRSNVITAATGAAIGGTREQRWVARRAAARQRRLELIFQRAWRAGLGRWRLAAERVEGRAGQP